MKSKDVIKRLKDEGLELIHAKGSHRQYKHPDRTDKVTVPIRQKTCRPGRSGVSSSRPDGHGKTDMRYPIVIHKEPDTGYGVTVPDLPGCFSAGDTLDDALVNTREAIECHLEGLLLDEEPIPEPGTIEQHQDNPDYTGDIWAFVDVDLSRLDSRTRRINITMPERVLTLIDEQARRGGETRSGFLARAALEYIGKHRKAS